MPKQQKPKSEISVNITGDVSGQVVVGNNNKMIKSVNHLPVASPRLEAMRRLLDELKGWIETEAPDNKREDALERVNELEHALFEPKPDLTTVEYVKKWFGKNLSNLAGSVAGITDEFNKHTL